MELILAVFNQRKVSFEDLLAITADIDFTGVAKVRNLLEQQPLQFVWDFIETKHYNASLKGGGTGLDKLKISQSGIEDPFGALDNLIENKMSYCFVDEDAFDIYGSFFLQPSRIAKAIIFYGIEKSFWGTRYQDTLIQILTIEVSRERKMAVNNVWLDKAMKKCEKRMLNTPTDLIVDFTAASILEKIVNNGVSLSFEIAERLDFTTLARCVSAKDIPNIERFLASVDDVIRFKEGMLAASSDSAMTAVLVGLHENDPSDDYKLKVHEFRKKHEGLIRSRLQFEGIRSLVDVYYS